jgi:hypothetical protein
MYRIFNLTFIVSVMALCAAAFLDISRGAEPLKMDDQGNVLVQIIHPDGSVTCCCPASRMKSTGNDFTDIYCAIPIREYDQWMIDLNNRQGRIQ